MQHHSDCSINYSVVLHRKYKTLYGRLSKAIASRRFYQYTRKKQAALYQQLQRYERRLQHWGIAVAGAAALFLTHPVAFAQPTPSGVEFRINTYTTDTQRFPSVAMDSDGDFVVTWQTLGQDGSGYGIYGQRYGAMGVAQGGEFQVNTYTTGNQLNSSVVMDSDGDFVVTWQSYGQDSSGNGIYGQRYNSNGVAQSSEFKVNSYTTSFQRFQSVAMDSDGDFVVTWNSYGQDGSGYGIYGQRYNSSGVAQGGEFQVNTYTTSFQRIPSVAIDSDGDFVVTWVSRDQDGNYDGIYGQRYNSSGVAQGSEFQVNTYTASSQTNPSVAMDSDGDFVITWQSAGQDGSLYGIYGQRYNSRGVAQGSEFQVNTYTTSSQRIPSVAMDSDGDFVVIWASFGEDGSGFGIYGQRYNSFGEAQGIEFQVNTYTTYQKSFPSVAMDSDGDFAVTWQSKDQDGSLYGIYGQRYSSVEFPVELLYFKGRSVAEGNLLTWSTASELNNEGFDIERSEDAKSWKSIGFVAGNGTTVAEQEYRFLDAAPLEGVQYYRLKQLDFDGQFEYSDIIALAGFGKLAGTLVYPNPVAEDLIIENGIGKASLYNAIGQLIQQVNIQNSRHLLSTVGLAPGIYVLKIEQADGRVFVQQVVK